jgi:hypothetical protein
MPGANREQRAKRKKQKAKGALRLRSVPQGAGLEARGEEQTTEVRGQRAEDGWQRAESSKQI